jgi:ferredoxin
MRIVVDYSRCGSQGLCEMEAPELFEIQEDGLLKVLDEEPSEHQRTEAEAAVIACPNRALSLAGG